MKNASPSVMDFVLEQVLCVRSLKNGPVELINKWSLININKCDFIIKIVQL